ncbi:MAG: topoisomerase [Cellvibrio sp.]|nr:topoisomerase [Cellvibrio sp.]
MRDIAKNIKLSNKTIRSILSDAEKAAQAINLIYVQDKQPGITRVKKGKAFHYFIGKNRLVDEKMIARINKLVIPPAWENVWICRLDNGHLQATGMDARNRKQYKYHTLWNALRNHTKFFRLYEFGKALPSIRKQLVKDLSLPGLPAEKVLAAAVCLMDQTGMRIGNDIYEKLYGSFGLTTLQNRHVSIRGSDIRFMFKGKKNIPQNVSINNKRLAKIVKQCSEIPGRELFQYYADDGSHKSIDSGMVNNYLKSLTGQYFTAKDFRTWVGTVQAITAFNDMSFDDNQIDIKKNIIEVLDKVATCLGNTRAVCKKYYVHPLVIDLYEKNDLSVYLKQISRSKKNAKEDGLSEVEKLLMLILEKESIKSATIAIA